MTSEWERRLADLWASFDDHGEDEFLQRMEALVDELRPAHRRGVRATVTVDSP
jgi:hypothetical protein